VLTLALVVAVAAAPPKLAATEWTVVKVEKDLASFFADELARGLRKHGVAVVTSADIQAVLGLERQRQLLGCADDSRGSCLAELGGALGCEGILQGKVARLDGSLRANLKVLSTADGHTVAETVVEASSEKDFVAKLEDAAGRLAAPLVEKAGPVAAVAERAPTLRSRAWIPAALGGAVAIAGGVLVGLAWRNSALIDQQLSLTHTVDSSLALARDGKLMQELGWVGLGVGAAALVSAGLMFLLGAEPPVQPQVLITPTGASVQLAWRWP